nr:MAG TPA: hypothetical protein [Caudoviricetes sp.]
MLSTKTPLPPKATTGVVARTDIISFQRRSKTRITMQVVLYPIKLVLLVCKGTKIHKDHKLCFNLN